MKKSDDKRLESIAREQYHDACYLGTDGVGADHFWSIYHQAVVIVSSDGEAVETVELENTPYETLGEWLDYTETERGEWETVLVADGGLPGMVAGAMEVAS
ncbi:hypothetical protein ELS19_17540 [Halogeometricum borinquense]|uniref:Uncharacterized protein n=1 Tax=Halogeometricum borinquense TaxID=60847 RepID=A0A482T6Y4_9EURY|nr:hypothetical protein [Halogeometricum borinquense]RYJ08355.1 hypothetical protein ELS19_17540 [Halogeometricum borinquense]